MSQFNGERSGSILSISEHGKSLAESANLCGDAPMDFIIGTTDQAHMHQPEQLNIFSDAPLHNDNTTTSLFIAVHCPTPERTLPHLAVRPPLAAQPTSADPPLAEQQLPSRRSLGSSAALLTALPWAL